MKIAIIGSGISGLSSAYLLHQHHDIQVFETAGQVGGHTATIDVHHKGEDYAIDTGFIVFNGRTYPHFIKLIDKLGVAVQDTEMSFSVSSANTGMEYAGTNLNTLFAQRSNLLNPDHWRMLRDILRFNKSTRADLDRGLLSTEITVGQYLQQEGYSRAFRDNFLIPMGSAIWSSSTQDMLDFPLLFFVRFFNNHGLLTLNDRPQWKVIKGGSKCYLESLCLGFADRIHCHSRITAVTRDTNGVVLRFEDQHQQRFDQIIFACHSNQALELLKDCSTQESEILSAIPYRANEVVLHTDHTILPTRKSAWSSWNYRLGNASDQPPALSYNMNILQGVRCIDTFIVTLNAAEYLNPDTIINRYHYAHPQFSFQGIAAQQRWQEINGVNRTWFCGAYWRNGFHEDGCWSGIRVAKALGAEWGLPC